MNTHAIDICKRGLTVMAVLALAAGIRAQAPAPTPPALNSTSESTEVRARSAPRGRAVMSKLQPPKTAIFIF